MVDEKKCIGCRVCVSVCPMNVFELKDNKSVPVNPQACIGCRQCVENCSANAIKLV